MLLSSIYNFYQGEPYEQKSIIPRRDAAIHIYRCERELHTLKIHMHSGLPYWVEGVYEVLKEWAEWVVVKGVAVNYGHKDQLTMVWGDNVRKS